MKTLFVLFFTLTSLAHAQPVDNSKNIYKCRVFEPNMNGGKFSNYRVSPEAPVAHHQVQDGVHTLEIHWYHWILNLSLQQNGVVPEVLGGATASHIKLRSHAPDLSVECEKEN